MTIPRNHESLACDVPGFTNDRILGFIYDLVMHQKPEICLEIGTFMGRSASVMCDALRELGGKRQLFCIDFFIQRYGPSYLNTPQKKYMINRCGPETASLYSDFEKLKYLEDCFRLTLSRKPHMQEFVTLIKGDTREVDFSVIPPVDFAYIDGDHSYEGVKNDALKVLSRLNPHGMIVFDDYYDRFPGVIQFVNELAAVPGISWLGEVDGDVALRVEKPEAAVAAL